MTASTADGPKAFTIAICGGGIAGLSLAIGLLKNEVPFHLYESAHAFAEVGAGISFGPNSLRAMKLTDPQIRQAYEKINTQNAFPNKKHTWFDFYAGMDCGFGKAGEEIVEVRDHQGVGQSSVHRAAFLDELVALVPNEHVTFGKRVVGVEELSRGVRLEFEDGGTADASAVIGCDGVKSKLRRIVVGEDDEAAHASFTGNYAYKGLVPMDKAVSVLGDEMARNSVMWLGLHGHVLTMPIEHGTCMNVVAIRTKPDGKWENERWVLPMDPKGMEADFADWGESVRDIMTLMEKPDVWALFDLPPAKTYYRGRTCLCGDAAHASTPHQGAGAGMALEDAYVMSGLLGAVDGEGGVEKAFEAFDRVRRPRTQRLVTTSPESGLIYQGEGMGVGDDPSALRENLLKRFDWIWEKHLEDDLEEALTFLRGKREGKGE